MNERSKTGKSVPDYFKTDKGRTKSNAIEIPSVSLPKGGGAIKGIDEKFSVNAVNGTSALSIPLPFSKARGTSPSLTISYNSGSGNGIFGLGWSLNIPSVKRKTDKGLPQYFDNLDSDVFVYSGEDLVPEFKKLVTGKFQVDANGDYTINEKDSADHLFTIRFYRPRTEGSFSRIERWTKKSNGEKKWRVISRDNLTTLFGWTTGSRIADPGNENRIFEWLPEVSFDDKGNIVRYIYERENEKGADLTALHNRNRFTAGKPNYTNLYLAKVLYGNKTPYNGFSQPYPLESDFLFATIFDYGEYDQHSPFQKTKDWAFRPDAFSEYKAGFEIRTTRLCKRVLLFHHFTGTGEYDGLVRSLDFIYDDATQFALLQSVTSCGYIRLSNGSYSSKKIPPVEFTYQQHEWNHETRSIPVDQLVHAPVGHEGQGYQFTDLFNEGLSGILTEQGNGWYYKHNLGGGKFEPAKLVSPKPSFTGLGEALQLADLDGDGSKQLVGYASGSPGYFELDDQQNWQGFHSFDVLPNIDLKNAGTRMIDLNGDGKPDLLIAGDDVFTWYRSEGRKGFSASVEIPCSIDEEQGPRVIFSDKVQTIFLADMSGDGLSDIVRIKNGNVCYWPNMGYGKFGTKVSMDNAPVFDHEDRFNSSYIKLADIDGSGTSDIIYLGANRFTCWMNQNGNAFSISPFEITAIPPVHSRESINVTDILGNGVACITWSAPMANDEGAPIRYIDLMNGKKPYLLSGYKNNFGKEVNLTYTASTKFYTEDKLAGNDWITRLHFPVHCVSKIETLDRITGYRFVNSYSYHHGYYDHDEREFRGFGMVEQLDSESFEHWEKSGASNVVEKDLHQAPVAVRTWYHTGAYNGKTIADQYEKDYWHEQLKKKGFPVTHQEAKLQDGRVVNGVAVPASYNLSAVETRQAYRACKGMVIRTETFARDAAPSDPDAVKQKALTPYSVASTNCIIELLQPKGKNNHAVYIVKESEAVTYNYERDQKDPRIQHKLNIEIDQYGNILEQASVVYPRINPDNSLPSFTKAAQQKNEIIYTKNSYTNDVESDNQYRLRLSSEVQTFELKNVAKTSTYYSIADFREILSDVKSETAQYHEIDLPLTAGKAGKRLVEHVRTVYQRNDLSSDLPLHALESLALPGESYQLAFTSQLLNDIYGGKVNPALMTEAKYVHSEGDSNWWVRSGRSIYMNTGESVTDSRNRFYQPVKFSDAFGAETRIKYYGNHYLLIDEITDHFGNKIKVVNFNFRTLQPKKMSDVNANLSETLVDELGFVKAIAIMGKGAEADELAGLTEESLPAEQLAKDHFFNATDSAALVTDAKNILNRATSCFIYDLNAWMTSSKPTAVATISREEHFQIDPGSPVQISFEYTSGLGEVIMSKKQAAPGKAKEVTVAADNTFTITDVDTSTTVPAQLRWLASGRTVKNNKGNAVKQYEPYFATSHHFENHKALVEKGVTPTMYYDAAGRLIKTIYPDQTFSRIEIGPWQNVLHDANDTVLETPWYNERTNRLIDARLVAEGKSPVNEKAAADKAALHANTPNRIHFDSTGRTATVADFNKDIAGLADEIQFTLLDVDCENNLRTITNALGNITARYKYDMLGNLVFQDNTDTGKRWSLLNILGLTVRKWDERNHEFQYYYDPIHRPSYSIITGGDGPVPLNNIFNRFVYGENLLLAGRSNETQLANLNVLGQTVTTYDTGGCLETPAYDFKGKPLFTRRKLFKLFKETPNWTDANLTTDLESETFIFYTSTDALGRITSQVAPDGSIITPHYNEGSLLLREEVLHPEETTPVEYIKAIEYNEKGQREKIVYGNNVSCRYYYDRLTFAVTRLETKRQNNDPLQDWYYTFDPVGNITHIEDRNAPLVFFNNQKTTAVSDFTYDALYRLRRATGRENSAPVSINDKDNWNDASFRQEMNPGDPMAAQNYTENYEYDAAGNILQLRHGSSWVRNYQYQAGTNRLTSTTIGGETYVYPVHAKHGYITSMPHLEETDWNFREELIRTVRQKRTDGGKPETTWYQYDGNGNRLRKITENSANPGSTPARKDERIYISGYETYRTYDADVKVFERESLSLLDSGERFVMIETVKMNSRTNPPVGDREGDRLTRYQLHNHIGSAAIELDGTAQANVLSYEEYHPFGTTAYQANSAAIRTSSKRYRYTGMERDDETGLSYHSARYYLPWLGRWLNADPAGISDGLNVFAYCRNAPIGSRDKSGKQGEQPSNWTRLMGGLRMVGGAVEVVAGGSLFAAGAATSEVGVGLLGMAGGAVVVGHGADTTVAGFRQMWSGTTTDSGTSTLLQGAGMTRTQANLTDAGAGVVFTLGAGAATRLPGLAATAVPEGASLVHMTDATAAASIEATGTLGRGGTVYASTAPLQTAGTVERVVRTGLAPAQVTTSVSIPATAAGAFRTPAVVGPISAWQRLSGTVYSAQAGSLELASGTFTATGSATNQLSIYAIDTGITTVLNGVPAMNAAGAPEYSVSSTRGIPASVVTSSSRSRPAVVSTSTMDAGVAESRVREPRSEGTGIPNAGDYQHYDDFRAAFQGPYTEDYIMERWAAVHGWASQ